MKTIICLLLSLSSPFASAMLDKEFKRIEDDRAACESGAKSVEAIVGCATEAHHQADSLVADGYAAMSRALEGMGKKRPQISTESMRRFATQQREWPAFREAECRLWSTRKIGARDEALEYEVCLYRETKIRAATIYAFLLK